MPYRRATRPATTRMRATRSAAATGANGVSEISNWSSPVFGMELFDAYPRGLRRWS